MSESTSTQSLIFDLGYPSGPFGLQVGQPVIRVRVPVSELLRRRIPHVIRANKELGRERVTVDSDQPIHKAPLIPETVELRSFQLVVWYDGRIGARGVDANWRVLRCRSCEWLAVDEETSEEVPALAR